MGLDPGLRTGVKVAVVDATGKVVDTATVYPHQPRNDWDGALHTLAKLAAKHNVSLISIGNGTGSRETDKLAQNLRAFVDAVSRAKPTGAKGAYMKKVSISSTMGPGVSVDVVSATQA